VVTGKNPLEDVAKTPTMNLTGRSMLAIVQAIPELEARTGRNAHAVHILECICAGGFTGMGCQYVRRFMQYHAQEAGRDWRLGGLAFSSCMN